MPPIECGTCIYNDLDIYLGCSRDSIGVRELVIQSYVLESLENRGVCASGKVPLSFLRYFSTDNVRTYMFTIHERNASKIVDSIMTILNNYPGWYVCNLGIMKLPQRREKRKTWFRHVCIDGLCDSKPENHVRVKFCIFRKIM